MILFHKVDKIASGSSYKTLQLWEIHNYNFTKSTTLEFVKTLSHENKRAQSLLIIIKIYWITGTPTTGTHMVTC